MSDAHQAPGNMQTVRIRIVNMSEAADNFITSCCMLVAAACRRLTRPRVPHRATKWLPSVKSNFIHKFKNF